jgi:hypothetical protein
MSFIPAILIALIFIASYLGSCALALRNISQDLREINRKK